jgi:hypothetical protein
MTRLPCGRTIVAAFALTAMMASSAFAQGGAPTPQPQLSVFGGVSFLPGGDQDFPRLTTSTGFQAGAAVQLTRWFALFADVGGHYSTVSDLGPSFPGVTAETSVYEYLFGPRFTFRSGRSTIFTHALAGVSTGHTNIGFSDSGFTFGGGAGLDVDVTRRIAIRGEFDGFWSFADIVEGNSRVALGLVVRLGG